jgi:phenylalanyl-tRNA synthetase beta chain
MEVASWHAPTIQRTSTRLGLRSEASGRFEKGLSVRQTMEAQAVAAQLMVELCGATLVPGTIDVGGPGEDPPPVALRPARSDELLGTSIPADRQAEILASLGFGVAQAAGDEPAFSVSVPHFRWQDVTREADLVEEVARIDGVDRLPATLPSRRGASGRLTFAQRARRRAEDALVGRGLYEAVGWSFTEPTVADRLRLPDDDPRRRFVPVANPMSEDHSVLRTTLLGSLLDVARFNAARGRPDLALFESGSIYLERETHLSADGDLVSDDAPIAATPDNDGPQLGQPDPGRVRPDDGLLPLERHALGGLLAGRSAPASWRGGDAPVWDLFAAKAVVGAVLDTLRVDWDVRPDAPHPFLHPGRAARVYAGETELGWLGEVHPLVARAWDLDGRRRRLRARPRLIVDAAPEDLPYRDVTTFPAVNQDLAIVLGEDVPAAEVLAAVRGAAGRLLERVEVFDVYRGAQVGEGRKSLALHLAFRASDRTLTEGRGPQAGRAGGRRARRPARRRAAWLARPSSWRARAATPARWPRPSCTATRGSTSVRSRRARTPECASTSSTRTTACRSCSTRSTSTTTAPSTRRSSPTRTARRPRPSPSCTSAASRSSTSAPTSACATRRPTRGGTASTAPRAVRATRSTGCPSSTATSCATAHIAANPGCFPTRRSSRWRRSLAPGSSPTSSSTRSRA